MNEYLTKVLENGTLGNSLLFSGPPGSGKMEAALEVAESLIKDPRVRSLMHPDLHLYQPEGKVGRHSIDSMRAFCHEVHLAPLESHRKIFIIDYAERMQAESANALLKTFEEPSLDSVIILISSQPERLLPTIISRCREVPFQRKEQQVSPLKEELIKILSAPRWHSYTDLMNAAKSLSAQVEQQQKPQELDTTDLGAQQVQQLTKEHDGAMSMILQNSGKQLFEEILHWFRDLELLRLKSDPNLLINVGTEALLQQQLERGESLPLAYVEQVITEAIQSLNSSIPLKSCLETLFLKLRRL